LVPTTGLVPFLIEGGVTLVGTAWLTTPLAALVAGVLSPAPLVAIQRTLSVWFASAATGT
jgi:hypothetical protein